MSALQDDKPQFQELSGVELEALRAEYERVWGEAMPTADGPDESAGAPTR